MDYFQGRINSFIVAHFIEHFKGSGPIATQANLTQYAEYLKSTKTLSASTIYDILLTIRESSLFRDSNGSRKRSSWSVRGAMDERIQETQESLADS